MSTQSDPPVDRWGPLRDALQQSLALQRVVITHLNADTCFMLHYPHDQASKPGRSHYNILIDPWLRGAQTDYFFWFSRQWHIEPSSVQTIADLNEMLCSVQSSSDNENTQDGREECYIDAVVVSHEFTDHCHKETLLEVNRETPVFATKVSPSKSFFKPVHLLSISEESSCRYKKLGPFSKGHGHSQICHSRKGVEKTILGAFARMAWDI